jgi:peroxiredoxin Q/BCP
VIEEGKKAPAFSLKNQDGKTVKLSDYAGKNVVLYF